jgi:hypothetical protein
MRPAKPWIENKVLIERQLGNTSGSDRFESLADLPIAEPASLRSFW